jgi:hypothetical protein
MKNTSFDFMFNAACYVNGDDPVAAQKVVRPFSSEFVKKGKRATLEAALECGGVVHQCDFFSGNGVPTTNPDLGGRLLQAKRVVSGPCEPCVGCTPTPCVKPPEPDCEHGPATYNPGDCTWECPKDECVQPPPPKCEFGPAIWNRELCSWSCPPPECKSCKDSSESLSCSVDQHPDETYHIVCDAYASHQGVFSSDFGVSGPFTGQKLFEKEGINCEKGRQKFDAFVTNSDNACPSGPAVGNHLLTECGEAHEEVWIPACPPPCRPDEPPPCREFCTWDEVECEWDCDFPVCDEGYEWNLLECKCEPLDICHVSNKKDPSGDWNIIETPKKFSPGHLKHMDPDKWCPPDYWGDCDGRSLGVDCDSK